MYCDECGRLLNRATGRCVCADGAPAPVGDTTSSAATALVAEPAMAGSAPAPFAPIDAAAPTPPPAPPAWDDLAPPPPPPGGYRTAHPVIPRVRTFTKVYDLHVFPDRLVLDKVKGADPETVGTIVGLIAGCGLLGACVGNLIGRAIAKQAIEKRVASTGYATPQELGFHAGARQVGEAQLVSLVARRHGSGGRIRMSLQGGETVKLSWAKAHSKGLDLAAALAPFAPGRVAVRPVSLGRKIGRYSVMGLGFLLAAAFTLAVVFTFVGRATTTPTPIAQGPKTISPGNPYLDRGCAKWGAFGQSLDGGIPTQAQMMTITRVVKPDFEMAALRDSRVQPAADAVEFLLLYFTAPEESQANMVGAEATKVDQACGFVPPA
jgi:hypothetical protein